MSSHILYGWVRFSLFFKHASLFYKKISKYHYYLVPKNIFLSLSIVAWQSQCLFVWKTMSYMTRTLTIAKANLFTNVAKKNN